MEQIEQLLPSALGGGRITLSTTQQPFARVDKILPDSIASRAGLLVDDAIVKINTISRHNFKGMEDVAKLVSECRLNQTALGISIIRANKVLTLEIKDLSAPLGCHIVPYSQ